MTVKWCHWCDQTMAVKHILPFFRRRFVVRAIVLRVDSKICNYIMRGDDGDEERKVGKQRKGKDGWQTWRLRVLVVCGGGQPRSARITRKN
jgi:hypothetical protein